LLLLHLLLLVLLVLLLISTAHQWRSLFVVRLPTTSNHGWFLDHSTLSLLLLLLLVVIESLILSSSHVLHFVTFETHLLQIGVLLLMVSVLNVNLGLSFFNLLEVALVSQLWVVLLLGYVLAVNLLLLLLNLKLVHLLSRRLNCHLAATSRDLGAASA
jgi:hypothetical protein